MLQDSPYFNIIFPFKSKIVIIPPFCLKQTMEKAFRQLFFVSHKKQRWVGGGGEYGGITLNENEQSMLQPRHSEREGCGAPILCSFRTYNAGWPHKEPIQKANEDLYYICITILFPPSHPWWRWTEGLVKSNLHMFDLETNRKTICSNRSFVSE